MIFSLTSLQEAKKTKRRTLKKKRVSQEINQPSEIVQEASVTSGTKSTPLTQPPSINVQRLNSPPSRSRQKKLDVILSVFKPCENPSLLKSAEDIELDEFKRLCMSTPCDTPKLKLSVTLELPTCFNKQFNY
jgi:hypothetical protein